MLLETIRENNDRPVDSTLVDEVRGLKQGGHLCLVYDDDPAEQMPALLPFIQRGLEDGEQCLYVADDLTVDELRDALAAHGIDVVGETARGALLLWTREQWRQPGELNSAAKAAQVQGLVDAALEAGYTGIRFAVEMTWTLRPDIDAEKLRHWESTINSIFTPDLPARIICQYSRRRLGPAVVQSALLTHPLAVLGSEICPNAYYDAPLLLGGAVPYAPLIADGARTDWMLSQLRSAREFEKEREQRIRAEAALREAERSRQRIEDLYRIAETAAAELRKAVAVKDEFLGLLSHELKTPITTIRGNAEVLRRSNGRITPDDREVALRDIEHDADRLHRMIDNLLVLARMEASQKIEREPELVRHIVEAVLAEHRKRFPRRQVELTVSAPVTPVLLHRPYFEQVLRNLLSNAEKYGSPDEPIEVRIERRHQRIIVTVLDRGPGIAPDEAKQIFTPFYRSPRTAHRTAGVGIGLVVCQRLVEAQGGTISVSPRRGGGSCFAVQVPANRAEAGDI